MRTYQAGKCPAFVMHCGYTVVLFMWNFTSWACAHADRWPVSFWTSLAWVWYMITCWCYIYTDWIPTASYILYPSWSSCNVNVILYSICGRLKPLAWLILHCLQVVNSFHDTLNTITCFFSCLWPWFCTKIQQTNFKTPSMTYILGG